MQQKPTRAVYAYWNEVRGARLAPRRLEIEAGRIAAHLAETLILETDASGQFRFRLAGTRICEAFGRELRGLNFLQLFADGERTAVEKALVPILNGGVVLFRLEGQTASEEAVTYEAALMPLFHVGESIERFLGVMTPVSTPLWLGADPVASLTVTTAETIWPARDALWAVAKPEPRFVPALNELAGARYVSSLGRRFRVIDGGQSKK